MKMKTLVIYLTFPADQQEGVESDRKYMMETLWESGNQIWAGHKYRTARLDEIREFEMQYPKAEGEE